MDNLIICVGRQLGSGGCEIAKLLAEKLGCKYYDKDLLGLAAEQSGFSKKIFERNDENFTSLKSLVGSLSSRVGRFGNLFYNSAISQESLFQIQSEVIQQVAEGESCVFVGRCADYILREKENLFSVFITADDDKRIAEVSEREGCDMNTARKLLEKKEAERASYYNYYTSKQWGSAASYDLCINSSILGIERTVDLIIQIINEKFRSNENNNTIQ